MTALPTGNVTFLFTDIEGSTRQWELNSSAMRQALSRHNALVRTVVQRCGGYVFKTMGDSFCVAFSEPLSGVTAAVRIHQTLEREEWNDVEPLRVRMALHAGAIHEDEGDYLGPPVNRVARLLSIGHGGQTLVSEAVRDLVAGQNLPGLGADWELVDLGFHRLRDLLRPEHVFYLRYPGLADNFAPLRSLDSLPNNLPRELSTLVGRETELLRIRELLSASSLVTLTGPGGAGKTRLAVLVGADVLGERPDGSWLVELAGLSDPDLMAQAVTTQLGVRDTTGRPADQVLTDYLRSRDLLLILDNCEHLVEAAARLVELLLRSCPKLTVLATSREGLGVRGESLFAVPPLPLPPDPAGQAAPDLAALQRNEAVRLFCERAAAAAPGFRLTEGNAAAVARICRRLDGIPLALELAAARARLLSPAQIAARLDDRFRLLTGGYRTDLERHQTLRGAIDWSYSLLSEGERVLLRRVAVFVGGWTLEAAEAVCPCVGVWESSEHTALPAEAELIDAYDALNLLGRLVERSLVVAEIGLEAEDLPPPLAGGLRYRMLESVREYAREHLVQSGEEVTLRHRHREYFMGVAEQADDGLKGPDQARWLDLLQREMDNFRAALGWSVESEARLKLAAALWRYWYQRGPATEGRSWLEGSLARSRDCSDAARARALTGVGNLAGQQADYPAAFAYLEECLAIQRKRGDRRGEAGALNNLGIIAQYQHDYLRAQGFLEESLAVNREIGRPDHIAAALVNLWVVAHKEGRGAESRAWLEEARAIYAQQEDSWRLAMVLCNLGILDRRGGNPDAAEQAYSEALARFVALDEGVNIALCLNGLGCVALDRGDFERAMRLFAIEERHRQLSGVPTPKSDIAQRDSELERLREALGPDGTERIWRETSELPLEQAVAWALGEQPTTN